MADVPGWDQVKPLLDDPAVPDDQKRELTLAYSAANNRREWGNGLPDEAEPYLDKYDDGWWRNEGERILNDRR